MKKYFSLPFMAAAAVLFILPWAAFAQEYTLLEPLPGTGIDDKIPINSQGLSKYVQTVFNIGIGVAIALAVVMIVFGGIQYLSTDAVGKKKEGLEKLWNALIGLLLALGAYVIIATINPDILKFNLAIAPLPKADSLSKTPPVPKAGEDKKTPAITDTKGIDTSANKDEEEIRARLRAANVTVNKKACPSGVRYQDVPGGCTTLAGISNATIDKIIALKKGCACAVEITGGTELGHKTHGVQYSNIVDLSLSADLLGWIKTNATPTSYSGCSTGNKYAINLTSGIVGQKSVFVDEKIDGNYPHFHVCF